MRCIGAAMQPYVDDIAPNSGIITHPSVASANYSGKLCLLSLTYGPDFTKKTWPTDMPKPAFENGTELRVRIGGSAQFLLIPTTGLKWEVPGGGSGETTPATQEDQQNRILIPIREIEIQWDFVDNPPISRLDGLMGMSNVDTFLGCEPETVLFETYSVEESFKMVPTNPHTNRVIVNLRVRKIKAGSEVYGWNHDYSADHGWAKMLFENDEPRHTPVTFADMFT
jgi:hypothetical protein